MKTPGALFLSLLAFILLSAFPVSSDGSPPAWVEPGKGAYRSGEILVRFRETATPAAAAFQHSTMGAAVRERLPRRIERVRLPPAMSVEQALAAYRANPLVEHAEPNFLVYRAQIPNDPHFGQQWGLYNTAEQTVLGTLGTTGADIGAVSAWDRHTGSGNIVVAVIDSGVDYLHPELADNIWTNPGETVNGQDTDGNGYVDDIRGWNFVGSSNDPMDHPNISHGTHVSGIIGAIGNNGVGVAGINWRVQIMPLKFLDGNGAGFVADAIKAIDYAVENGARIINASYGYYPFEEPQSRFEREAIERARDFGVLFIAAAGNEGVDNDIQPFYPASHPVDNILAVAASNHRDNPVGFSNYGRDTVHLAAPGLEILSTTHRDDGLYGSLSGTSMSAPMVSGAAALLLSYRPELEASSAREILLLAARQMAAFQDMNYAGGRLDLAAAMDLDPAGQPPLKPFRLRALRISATRIDLSWQDNSSAETAFRVERKRFGEGFDFNTITSLPENSETYIDQDVFATEGTRYSYRVLATNSSGDSDFTNEVQVITPLNPPTTLIATTDSGLGIVLDWQDNSEAEDGFQVERRGSSGTFAPLATVLKDTTEYLDDAVITGSTYTYRVLAFNAASGSSEASNEVTITAGSDPVIGAAGGSSGGGGCFIATAAFGSPLHPKVEVLRQFRDRHLLTSSWGRFMVRTYYRVSPPLAEVIAGNETLRNIVRGMLAPVVWLAELAVRGEG